MTHEDRRRWDARYAELGVAPGTDHGPPPALAPAGHLFPEAGLALDVACGRGRAGVWLALRGMEVWGVDASPVAISLARELAAREGVAGRCRFDVVDLDGGLPAGPPADVVLCHLFRDPRLYGGMAGRLAPGGLLAVAVRSEVGAGPGPYRARPGELREAFAQLHVLAEGETGGVAWLTARRRSPAQRRDPPLR